MNLQQLTSSAKGLVKSFGLPRIIIGLFLLSLFITAPFVGVNIGTSLSDTFNRFGMNAVMVLAMVPMIHSGCGLNFGLPLGNHCRAVGSNHLTASKYPRTNLISVGYSVRNALCRYSWLGVWTTAQ